MNRFWNVAPLFLLLLGGIVVAFVLLSRDRAPDSVSVPDAPPAQPTKEETDPLEDAVPPPGPPVPVPVPVPASPPAPPAAEDPGTGSAPSPPPLLPGEHRPSGPEPGGPGPEALERLREETRRAAEETVKAQRAREIKMFEDLLGPIEDDKERTFLDLYYAYHQEAALEFRRRVTAGEEPDRKKIFAEARDRLYEKLESVLTPEQLASFRTWLEEKCYPKRGE